MSTDGGGRQPGPEDAPRPDGSGPGAGPGAGFGYGVPGPGPGPWAGWGAVPPAPQPGVIPLHPLGVGEVIGGVFSTLKGYARPVYLPVLTAALGALVVTGVALGAAFLALHGLFDDLRDQPGYRATDSQVAGLVTAIGVVAVLLLCCVTALYTVAHTTSSAVIRHAVLGRIVTVRQIWKESRPFLWRVLGAQLLAGLATLGILVVSLLPAMVLGLATGSGPAAAIALVCVIPGWLGAVYVQVRLVLVIPVVVLEDQRPAAALRRAWKLNEGGWWRSLGIPYLINMIGSFATQFLLIPFVAVGAVLLSLSTPGEPDPGGRDAVPTVTGMMLFALCLATGFLLATTLTLPLTPLTHGLLYADRRIRRENLAPTLAAAAGAPHGGPVPGADAGPRGDYGQFGA